MSDETAPPIPAKDVNGRTPAAAIHDQDDPEPSPRRRVLVSLTGNKVHRPAIIGQKDTGRTMCAPFGRMGARPMRLRFAVEGGGYVVNCKTCLKVEAVTEDAAREHVTSAELPSLPICDRPATWYDQGE